MPKWGMLYKESWQEITTQLAIVKANELRYQLDIINGMGGLIVLDRYRMPGV